MRRTLLAAACLCTLAAGLHAANVVRPQHEELVAANTGPPAAIVPPVLFAPTTTTTTTVPPPTTTVPPSTTNPPRPVDRPARVRPTATRVAPQTSPQPVDGDLVFAAECLIDYGDAGMPVGLAHACWDPLIAKYPWDRSFAFSTMMCESHGNTHSRNPSGATGLMQILSKEHGVYVGSIEPNTNMRQAWGKYTGSHGWGPWSQSAPCARAKRNG